MNAWLTAHRQAFADAVRNVTRAPFATALSLLTLATALAMPLAGRSVLDSMGTLAKQAGAEPRLTAYLAVKVTAKDRDALQAAVTALPGVRDVRLISKEQALAELRGREGVRDLLAGLPGNPLPDALTITPASRDAAAMSSLQTQLAKMPGVANVDYDSAWVNRLAALVSAGTFATSVLGVLLGLAIVAVMFNTIRLQVLTRAQELEIASLFGATRPWLRRPFLYFGACEGLAGGILAVAIVQGALWGLNRRLDGTLGVFGLPDGFDRVSAAAALVTLVAASALGWMGAWLAVGRHLERDRRAPVAGVVAS